jgi:predicted RNase H-like HicB family nuclease
VRIWQEIQRPFTRTGKQKSTSHAEPSIVWFNKKQQEIIMKAEFTAIIEKAPEGGFWAICPEVPGANGQGEIIEEAKTNLREGIKLILEDRKADILRGLPDDAIQEKMMIG